MTPNYRPERKAEPFTLRVPEDLTSTTFAGVRAKVARLLDAPDLGVVLGAPESRVTRETNLLLPNRDAFGTGEQGAAQLRVRPRRNLS